MTTPRKPRWKTLLVGLAVLGVATPCVRMIPDVADSMFRSAILVLGVLLALRWIPLWVLLLSRLRWKVRGGLLAAMLVFGAAMSFTIRVDGYHGDILPIVSWAWEPELGAVYDPVESTTAAWNRNVPGAIDFPSFLGPGGTNLVTDEAQPERWFELEPEERWRRKVGLGWSSFAVAQGLAITQEQRDDEEYVVAYALEDGAAVWTHHQVARFSEEYGGDGPRATPTITGKRVLTMGATGVLDCLDLESGELCWTRSVLFEAGHHNLSWGKSSSPLVVGDQVIVTLGRGEGGSTAAYALEDGELLWRSGEFEASYATPVLRELDGEQQIVVLYADHLAGHRLETGEVLWSTQVPRAAANVANPIVLSGNRVLASIGYGKGSLLFEVTRDEGGTWQVEQLWRNLSMKPKFTNLVVHEPHAFGLDEGRLACIDLSTGRRVWKGSRWGHGQVLGVGGHLVVQAEDGEVVVIEASPEEERIATRFDALQTRTWNQPAFAGRYLLVRNDREAICFAYPER